jgi:D-glycero-D-manno-heptose 1,7-bisphosphate phosphatase
VTGKTAVFLDRDGVLCEAIVRDDGKPYAPTRFEDFALVADGAQQVARLRAAGLLALVFTNQPEIANGLLQPAELERMHAVLRTQMAVDDIYVCPHGKNDGCACHKPLPGMLTAAAREWRVDLEQSFVIGDRWRDIDAGRAVGCFTVLLERPYSACTTANVAVADLASAVDLVLDRVGRKPWNT